MPNSKGNLRPDDRLGIDHDRRILSGFRPPFELLYLTLRRRRCSPQRRPRLNPLSYHSPLMLIPIEELKILYQGAIADVTDSPARPILSAERYQGGFGFIRNGVEYRLAFDALESPECMTLQTNLDFISGRAGLENMRRLVAQLNAEKKGVKFVLVEAPAPFIVCSVEAILAAYRRIPNTEVAEAILQSAIRRLEDVTEEIRLELGRRR